MGPRRGHVRSRRRLIGALMPAVVLALALVPMVPSHASTPLGWSQLNPTSHPTALWGSAMAFDPASNQLVLFGGYDSVTQHYSGDTWVWTGTAWQKPTTITQNPTARYGGSMAYDAGSGKLVLFGGSENGGYSQDTWLWDGSDWAKATVTQAPPIRQDAGLAPDSAGHLVLFGGADPYSQLSDTWLWSGGDWSPGPSGPPGRTRASMAFDPLTNQVVLFGGLDNSLNSLGDTWIWDGSTWSDANSPTALPASPSPRRDSVMAFDPDTGGLLLFSGYDGSQILADTWAWTSTGWASQSISPSPPGRANGAMAFNPVTDQLFLFGGTGAGGVHFNGTWVYGAPIPSSPAHVALSLSTSSVTANGSDTSIATATVTDAGGNPVTGQPVTFSTNDDVTFGSVTDNLDGTYTATITASTTSGDEKITAHDIDLTDTKTLHELPGPAAQISVFFDSDTLQANGSDQTYGYAYVSDANGNGRPNDTVTFSTSEDVTLGSVHSEGDGTYDVLITASTTPGDETITAHDGVLTGSSTLHETAPPSQAPVVITQPVSQTVSAGQTATFTSAASGSPSPTVQWFVRNPPSASFKPVNNGTSPTLNVTATSAADGNVYRAVFTNSAGTATSNDATLAVNTAPVVTQQPVSQSVAAGVQVTLKAAATGKPTPTVQWEVSTDGGTNYNPINLATAPTYTFISLTQQSGYRYRAVFTNSVGVARSNPAILTVGKTPTNITLVRNPAFPAFGDGSTWTATVTRVFGIGSPTGSVQFSIGSLNLGPPVPLVGGKASLTVGSMLPECTPSCQMMNASYSGDTTFKPSAVSADVTFKPTNQLFNTVNGNQTLSGGFWFVQGAHIKGSLTITAGTDVLILNSTIDLGVTGTNPRAVGICNTTVKGSVSITGASGLVLLGDPGDDRCASNNIQGDVSLSSNAGGMEVQSNKIGGNVSLTGNSGAGPFPEDLGPEVEANKIQGNLSCSGNSAQLTNDGKTNTVTGTKSGQCAAF